jgi:hypothetical protein
MTVWPRFSNSTLRYDPPKPAGPITPTRKDFDDMMKRIGNKSIGVDIPILGAEDEVRGYLPLCSHDCHVMYCCLHVFDGNEFGVIRRGC